jgi:cyanophycinase
MTDKYLFLFGGNPSLEKANKVFIEKAGGKDAKIALLIMNREGWKEYIPRYTTTWKDQGVEHYSVVLPDDEGHLNFEEAIAILRESTGIYIGGGDTEKYHNYYAEEPIKAVLKECYNNGIPIAGCSAGALILPETCVISSNDSLSGEMIVKEGIGLLSNLLISVHYTEWNEEKNLYEGMARLKTRAGYGIDEEACAVFYNGEFEYAIGNEVHKIEIIDSFEGKYKISSYQHNNGSWEAPGGL